MNLDNPSYIRQRLEAVYMYTRTLKEDMVDEWVYGKWLISYLFLHLLLSSILPIPRYRRFLSSLDRKALYMQSWFFWTGERTRWKTKYLIHNCPFEEYTESHQFVMIHGKIWLWESCERVQYNSTEAMICK